MKQQFIEYKPKGDTADLIDECEDIIGRYQKQRLRLTLRQLYYQLVSQNLISNTEKEYKRISSIVSKARLGGMLDWDAIEDRMRQPVVPNDFEDLQALVRAALASYKLPRWRGQEYCVELWVEKDALAGVLAPMAREFHITLMVNRGYSSQSAMYESAARMHQADDEGRTPVILYLGDFDPSGEDMVRDIRDRMAMFEVTSNLVVDKIALTLNQVKHYNPPPNPAKLTDPRAKKFVAAHGGRSWEVDALPPEVLQAIIRREIMEYVDMEMMGRVKAQEEEDKHKLRNAVSL